MSCKVRGTLEIVEKLRGKQLIAVAAIASGERKAKPKVHYTTVIPSAHTITLKPGKKLTLKLTLNRTAVALLKRRHRLSAKLVLTQSDEVIATRTVKLTAPKAKKIKRK